MFTYDKPEQKQATKNIFQKKEAKRAVSLPNMTGSPCTMKTPFEKLSGFSFDDIRMHYNLDKPVQLQALAYTQSNQAYVGSGQEQHPGHELGHVVQQKEGRVRPIPNMLDMSVNDNKTLEVEADRFAPIQCYIGKVMNEALGVHNLEALISDPEMAYMTLALSPDEKMLNELLEFATQQIKGLPKEYTDELAGSVFNLYNVVNTLTASHPLIARNINDNVFKVYNHEVGGSGACGNTAAFLEDAIGFPNKKEGITVEVGLKIIGELLKRKIPAIRIDISKTHSFVVFQYGNEIEIVQSWYEGYTTLDWVKKNAIIPKDTFYSALVDSLTLKKESANKFLFDRNEDLVPDGFNYMKVSWSNQLSKEDSLMDYQYKTAGNIYNKIMNRKTAWGLN